MQYITDATGNKVSVILPLVTWRAVLDRYPELNELVEDTPNKLTLSAITEIQEGKGSTTSLEELSREWESD